MRSSGFGAAADFGAGEGGGFGTPWGAPTPGGQDFDAAFEAWWKKMNEE